MSELESKEIQEPKQFEITFSENDLNVIMAALGEIPAKHAIGVINNIQQQIN